MNFRTKLLLAVFFFSLLPLAYLLGVTEFVSVPVAIAVIALCFFTLMGSLAGAFKVDRMVKDAEERCLSSEVELQSFLERVHDGILRLDGQGKIREVNTAMGEFLRCDPDALKGRPCGEYLKSPHGPPDPALIPAGQMRRTVAMKAVRKVGAPIEMIVDLYLLKDKAGQPAGLRCCARPAEKLLAEEKLKAKLAGDLFRSSEAKLKAFLAEADAAVASGGDAVAVRSSLQAGIGGLRRELVPILEASGLAAWKPVLRRAKVSPELLVPAVCARFEPWARLRNRKLTGNCFEQRFELFGDPDHLMELLGELVENSIKYTRDGGEIFLTYRGAEDRHSFVVSDNGIGLSQEDLSRLFAPFFRADNPENASIPGLGLGLWTAKRIAEAHHGSLTASSQLGHETVFTFVIPKTPPKEEGEQEIEWIG